MAKRIAEMALVCSVYAPNTVAPGATVLVQVILHRLEDQHRIEGLARATDASANRQEQQSLQGRLPLAAQMQVAISFPIGATGRLPSIASNPQTIRWEGRTVSASFVVKFPSDADERKRDAFVQVMNEGVPAAIIKFSWDVERPAQPTLPRRTKHVFISCNHSDKPRIRPIVEALLAAGLSIWIDEPRALGLRDHPNVFGIAPSEWRMEIERALVNATAVIVFWSFDAVRPDRQELREEASSALQSGKLIQVLIDPVLDGLPLRFRSTQALDVSARLASGSNEFADIVAAANVLLAGADFLPDQIETSFVPPRVDAVSSGGSTERRTARSPLLTAAGPLLARGRAAHSRIRLPRRWLSVGSRLVRPANYTVATLLVVTGLTYALALAALRDLEQPAASAVAPVAAGTGAVVVDAGGRGMLMQAGQRLAALDTHAAPLVSADLVQGAVVTSAHDGTVRFTRTTPVSLLEAATLPALSSVLYERLWRPYGSPVANQALWLAAQVLPLHMPETRKARRGRVFKDCPECPEMVEIEPGSFFMGSPWTEQGPKSAEGPRRLVTIAQAFTVGRFEVTFDEWDGCLADGGCNGHRPSDNGWGRGRRPVINVSWNDAQAYVKWVSEKTGETYRLLSEAEWEYAARAGTTSRYAWGDDIGIGNANCDGCGSQRDNRQTAPVGSFEANALGLHDMHGNVSEWVEDSWRANYEGGPTDGTTWPGGDTSSRIVRGGSWRGSTDHLRSADRKWEGPFGRIDYVGFRLARTL